jgi:hypothetical protein
MEYNRDDYRAAFPAAYQVASYNKAAYRRAASKLYSMFEIANLLRAPSWKLRDMCWRGFIREGVCGQTQARHYSLLSKF